MMFTGIHLMNVTDKFSVNSLLNIPNIHRYDNSENKRTPRDGR